MKAMKGKILKRLKSISKIKPRLIFQVNNNSSDQSFHEPDFHEIDRGDFGFSPKSKPNKRIAEPTIDPLKPNPVHQMDESNFPAANSQAPSEQEQDEIESNHRGDFRSSAKSKPIEPDPDHQIPESPKKSSPPSWSNWPPAGGNNADQNSRTPSEQEQDEIESIFYENHRGDFGLSPKSRPKVPDPVHQMPESPKEESNWEKSSSPSSSNWPPAGGNNADQNSRTPSEQEHDEIESNFYENHRGDFGFSPKVPDPVHQMPESPKEESNWEKSTLSSSSNNSIILYTTSLRGIRKTFEDCKTVRFLLQSFRVRFHERDVSMDMALREELWRVSGGRVVPPRLFVRGKYVGGADEVVQLHEEGNLRRLLQGIPRDASGGEPCGECAGVGFVVCSDCSGSCKLISEDELTTRCPDCNENGLIRCPICFL